MIWMKRGYTQLTVLNADHDHKASEQGYFFPTIMVGKRKSVSFFPTIMWDPGGKKQGFFPTIFETLVGKSRVFSHLMVGKKVATGGKF